MFKNNPQLNKLMIIVDLLIAGVSYFFAWYYVIVLRAHRNQIGTLPNEYYMIGGVCLVLFTIFMAVFFNIYGESRQTSGLKILTDLIKLNIIVFLVPSAFLFIYRKNPYLSNFSTLIIIVYCLTNLVMQSIIRIILITIIVSARKRGFNQRHILLIGYSDASFKFIDKSIRNPGLGYHLCGIVADNEKLGNSYRNVSVIGNTDDLQSLIEKNDFDEIVIALKLNEYDKLGKVVSVCEKSGVHTKFIPDYGTIIPTKPQTEDLDGLPVINIRYVPLSSTFNQFIKRVIDIIGSLVGIILFSPAMLVIAIAIKITNKGSVIYTQERVGRHGKLFTMYKFRSMSTEYADKEQTGWTTKDDPRVTKVGKVIRKISFDELPQFFNVLIGDMSLVGPRPERENFVEEFKERIPRYMIKHLVKPGMTGWAQINGLRGNTPVDKRIRYDLWYIENWTLGLDIKIMFLTFFKGFIDENAY